jgi:hypothetical protein
MPKKTKNQRPTVKVRDLKPKKDAKGGQDFHLPHGNKVFDKTTIFSKKV